MQFKYKSSTLLPDKQLAKSCACRGIILETITTYHLLPIFCAATKDGEWIKGK